MLSCVCACTANADKSMKSPFQRFHSLESLESLESLQQSRRMELKPMESPTLLPPLLQLPPHSAKLPLMPLLVIMGNQQRASHNETASNSEHGTLRSPPPPTVHLMLSGTANLADAKL